VDQRSVDIEKQKALGFCHPKMTKSE